jgi:hypothetical protein
MAGAVDMTPTPLFPMLHLSDVCETYMTDDENTAASESPKEPSAADQFQQSTQNTINQLSSGERLIAIGALLILVVDWLVGTLILDEYGLSNITVLIPIGILAAMYFYYSGTESPWHHLYGTIVKVGAWAMVIITVYALIDDTLITSNRYSGATLFFELVFYAAGIFFAVGAWQLRGDTR